MKRNFRAQSAMEYLMTYGWAILIIAVVLGALFSLGIFSGGAALGSLCVPIPGFRCTAATLSTSGNLSFTFGENTGTTLYDVAMACSSAATANGLPVPSNMVFGCTTETGTTGCCTTTNSCSMVWMSVSGTAIAATGYNAINSLAYIPTGTSTDFVPNGQQFSVTGLKCWAGSVGPLGSPSPTAIGTAFSGSLWINYTLQAGAPSSTNPVYSVKFAALNTKSV